VLSASGQKELFESLRAVYSFADKRTLVLIDDPKFCENLLSLDETMVRVNYHPQHATHSCAHSRLTLRCPCGEQLYTEYKFGVLYYKDGQTNEDDMFGNVDTSPEYEEFLQLLGQKVCLPPTCYASQRSCARSSVLNALRVMASHRSASKAGSNTQLAWTRRRTRRERTPSSPRGRSTFASPLACPAARTPHRLSAHRLPNVFSHEIMFHVSTMLPYSKKDKQQIERKRHLGNDAVLIVFHDGTTPFQPQCITSKYSQVLPPRFPLAVCRGGGAQVANAAATCALSLDLSGRAGDQAGGR
jgi:hypothetical protein